MNAPYLAQVSEQGEMSITDDLRNEANKMDWIRSAVLRGIADRIDGEHERELSYQKCAFWHDASDEELDKFGLSRAYLDADGVPIHFGDKVTVPWSDKVYEVRGFSYTEQLAGGQRMVWVDVYSLERMGNVPLCAVNSCHHYHEPTVEDVLREFAEKMSENISMYTSEAIDADEWRDADNKTIAEYAAKLRLANDEKEQ